MREDGTPIARGICIIDDLIEFAPQHALQYKDQIAQVLATSLSDEYPEVRQAAAYGFGAMALNSAPEWKPIAAAALEPLARMISLPEARSTEESTIATENAISAVAKIVRHCTTGMDTNSIVSAFMQWLPIYEDKEESVHVYDFFAELLEANNPAVLGTENANLPRILDIITKAFHLSAFDETEESARVKQRLITILKSMEANQVLFEAVLKSSTLNDDERSTLQHLLH